MLFPCSSNVFNLTHLYETKPKRKTKHALDQFAYLKNVFPSKKTNRRWTFSRFIRVTLKSNRFFSRLSIPFRIRPPTQGIVMSMNWILLFNKHSTNSRVEPTSHFNIDQFIWKDDAIFDDVTTFSPVKDVLCVDILNNKFFFLKIFFSFKFVLKCRTIERKLVDVVRMKKCPN